MKKRMLAFAILGGWSMAASAQSSVTLFGAVDLALAYEKNSGKSAARLDNGWSSGSRVGFKGEDDIGNGLSVTYHLEMGLSADTGALGNAGLGFGRQSTIGLKGAFGAILAGRQYLPMWLNAPKFDPFGDMLGGDSANLFNYSDARVNNSISYGYEKNGFHGRIIYGLGEVAGNGRAGRTIAGFAAYTHGAMDVVFNYTGITDPTGGLTGKTALLGGNYDLGVAKVFLTYATNKDVTSRGVLSRGADSRNALIGFSAPVGGSGKLQFSYIHLEDRVRENSDANQLAIGYVHNLSKRTAFYTSLSRMKNQANASYLTGYLKGALGSTDRLLIAGIRHLF